MMPPLAWMISSAASAASRFSIFAITGMSSPRSSRRACTGSRSPALRTNDTASRSMPWSIAKSTQSRSDSSTAAGTASTPGRFIP